VLGGAGCPTGERLAPVIAELVARLRRFEELIIPDATAALLISMSAATMDRRLGPDWTGPATPSMPGFAQGMVFG